MYTKAMQVRNAYDEAVFEHNIHSEGCYALAVDASSNSKVRVGAKLIELLPSLVLLVSMPPNSWAAATASA